MIKDDLRREAQERKQKAIDASFKRIYRKALTDFGFVKLDVVYQEVANDTGYSKSGVQASLRGYFERHTSLDR